MLHLLRRALGVALTGVLLAMTAGQAANTTVSGTVHEVDMRKGQLTLRSAEGNLLELQAPVELMTHLQPGDRVEVRVAGKEITTLQKQQGMPPQTINGPLPQRKPGALRPSQ
ncbi:MAG: hypothetical protein AB7N91_13235 [Candidatus Tectimicrobiota bacterium]